MQRPQKTLILRDLEKKLVLLSGPRQSGKTTLAKSFFSEPLFEYLNFDRKADRTIILKETWTRQKELIVFDELHKMRFWKRWIKGVYDTEGVRPRLLVTGSARLDIYRKGGDSLAGRFFLHRLHPLSIAEIKKSDSTQVVDEIEKKLLTLGGFPEPFLNGNQDDASRWRRSHLDVILREDLIDLEKVRDLKSIEILVDLLAERVGSTISYSSLAKDIQVSPHTIKKWIEVLERLYVVFVVTPNAKNISRAVLKEPKIYFFDTGRVTDAPDARFENLVACALLKRNHYLEDMRGEKRALHYVRDHQKREVDFLTLVNNKPEYLIETKLSDESLSPSLRYFDAFIKPERAIQLVRNLSRTQLYGKIQILKSAQWLSELEL